MYTIELQLCLLFDGERGTLPSKKLAKGKSSSNLTCECWQRHQVYLLLQCLPASTPVPPFSPFSGTHGKEVAKAGQKSLVSSLKRLRGWARMAVETKQFLCRCIKLHFYDDFLILFRFAVTGRRFHSDALRPNDPELSEGLRAGHAGLQPSPPRIPDAPAAGQSGRLLTYTHGCRSHHTHTEDHEQEQRRRQSEQDMTAVRRCTHSRWGIISRTTTRHSIARPLNETKSGR